MQDKIINFGFHAPGASKQINAPQKTSQSISSAVSQVSQSSNNNFATVVPGTAHLQGPNYSNQSLDSTNSWVNAEKDIAKFSVNKMYFGEGDYSQNPGSLGPYTFPSDQSRLKSAIDLGSAPFATDSQTIAGNYGFSTAISSGTSSTGSEEIDILGLDDETNDDSDDFTKLGEDLEKEFDRIDAHKMRYNPDARIENEEFNKRGLIKEIENSSDLSETQKDSLKQEVEKLDELPKEEQETVKQEIKNHTKEEQEAPPPPKEDEEGERRLFGD